MPPSAEQYAAVREALEAWQPLASHPNIAALRSAFVSSEVLGTPALYVVHDYHPGAVRAACTVLHLEGADREYFRS